MKKIVHLTLAASIALALTACHNDKKDAPVIEPPPVPVVPATLDISGAAVKGALIGAKVQIYRASDIALATPLTTEPADVQTDENGDYTATVVDASGEAIVGALVVNITADDDTVMRCDAAVMCADGTLRGENIPNEEIAGISVSTLTFAAVDADGESIAIDADANTFTTMATDAVFSQLAINTNLDIDNLSFEGVVALQKNASLIVGEILGIDLSSTNIYDIKIVDSTDTQAFADAAAAAGDNVDVTTQLTSFNAALAVLDTTGSTISATINNYVQTVAVVSTTLVDALAEGTDIAIALAEPDAVAALAVLAPAQTAISDEATLIQDAVQTDIDNNDDIDIVIEKVIIPAIVPPIEIDLGDIIVPTGATGGTGG
ncbi:MULTISPECIES: hypothetical protein [Colwellia]|uniref:Lipoprotein n=1 Tax=Colwellia marinimaniae TaxID=1513592 RepID=A0ABQ0MTT2_9GAMM|nr:MULTISPECIES: hypothetical protein [Colwellia]GAW95754.1 hypothetical protein MTCD1_01357 [Colwellia marinimaniae]